MQANLISRNIIPGLSARNRWAYEKNLNMYGGRMFSKLISFFTRGTNSDQFNHEKAQDYELRHAIQWTKENVSRLYPEIIDKEKQKSVVSEEWFDHEKDWKTFVDWIDGKACLEVGSGPAGAIIRWWWAKKRIIIDPLIAKYKKLSIDIYGKTWFTEDMELHAINAEVFLPNIESCIDGAIVCRNALDHCEDPKQVLVNISKYAQPGAYLLLWTDLFHIKGHDEGHTDITSNVREFARFLEDLGFDIEFESTPFSERETINFGCRARKRNPK